MMTSRGSVQISRCVFAVSSPVTFWRGILWQHYSVRRFSLKISFWCNELTALACFPLHSLFYFLTFLQSLRKRVKILWVKVFKNIWEWWLFYSIDFFTGVIKQRDWCPSLILEFCRFFRTPTLARRLLHEAEGAYMGLLSTSDYISSNKFSTSC